MLFRFPLHFAKNSFDLQEGFTPCLVQVFCIKGNLQLCPNTHWFRGCSFCYPQFAEEGKKRKIKEKIKQLVLQAKTGHNPVKSKSSNMSSTWLIFICPYSMLTCRTCLHSFFCGRSWDVYNILPMERGAHLYIKFYATYKCIADGAKEKLSE